MEAPENSAVQTPEPEASRWYEGIGLEDAKLFIKSNIMSAARSFIAIGYYLKAVRNKEMYLEDGHATIWEFARSEFGISMSTASRYMTMNDRFSRDGNSPIVADAYKEFGKSQLQEMLSLTDEQLEQVKPTDRIEDIRTMRKPKEIPYVAIPVQVELTDFPGVDPEEAAASIQVRKEAATNQPEKQIYTISAEDLLPEPEQQEPEETIAISQQEPEANTPKPVAAYDKSALQRMIQLEQERPDMREISADRLTIPDEPIEGGMRRAVVDARAVREQAMTLYWRLKEYEDICPVPELLKEVDELYLEKCREVTAIKNIGRRVNTGGNGKCSICGTCTYHEYDRLEGNWGCINPESEYYGILTTCGDRCDEWEEKI